MENTELTKWRNANLFFEAMHTARAMGYATPLQGDYTKNCFANTDLHTQKFFCEAIDKFLEEYQKTK